MFEQNKILKHHEMCHRNLRQYSASQTIILGNKFIEILLQKQPSRGVLEIWSKFTGQHPCWSAFSIKLQSNFIEMSLWHWCSPVNLLYIFGTHFPKNTSGRLPLPLVSSITAFRHQAYNNLHTLISLRRLLNYAFFCSVFLGWEKNIGTNWKVFFVRILISDYSVPKNNSGKGKFPK